MLVWALRSVRDCFWDLRNVTNNLFSVRIVLDRCLRAKECIELFLSFGESFEWMYRALKFSWGAGTYMI